MWKSKFVFKDLLAEGNVAPEKVREIAEHMLIRLKGSVAFTPAAQMHLAELFADIQD